LASLSLGIGIPAPLVSHSLTLASPLSQYWYPALSASHSSALAPLALWCLQYLVSVSLSCLRTSIHNPASVSPSIGFVPLHSPYTPQYHRYSYTPTSLLYRNTQSFSAEQSSLQLYTIPLFNLAGNFITPYAANEMLWGTTVFIQFNLVAKLTTVGMLSGACQISNSLSPPFNI